MTNVLSLSAPVSVSLYLFLFLSLCLCVSSFQSSALLRPDVTAVVEWALNASYLALYPASAASQDTQ